MIFIKYLICASLIGVVYLFFKFLFDRFFLKIKTNVKQTLINYILFVFTAWILASISYVLRN